MAVDDCSTTAKHCSKCGETKPVTEFSKDKQKSDGLASACRGCKRIHAVAYYAANREKEQQRLKDWAIANPERAKARRKRHYEENKEAVLDQCKKWRAANIDRVRQKLREYEAANRDKIRERKRRFRQANPDLITARRKEYVEAKRPQIRVRLQKYWLENKHRLLDGRKAYRNANRLKLSAHAHARRARVRNAPGSHTGEQLVNLHKLQRGRCAVCGDNLKKGRHVDHIVPLAKGGSNDITNIQLLCPPCNLSKNAKDPLEFARQRGMLL